MRNRNAWRFELDPRDPDYEDPPEIDGDEEPLPELDDVYGDGKRDDGPWNYWPMRGDV